jgi:RNA polymerase sigma-32 factor
MSDVDLALSRYIAKVNRYPRLLREEEEELWRRWQFEQDPRTNETLICANLRYVIAIALKYRRYGLPVAELIAEGNSGIMRALLKFEPNRGNRFVTYASYWIRAFILSHVVKSWSMVGGGSGVLRSKVFFRLRRERVRITNLLGESDQALELLAERFATSPDRVEEMIRRVEARDISLNARVFDDDGTTLMDTLAAQQSSQEESYAYSQESLRVNHVVHAALEALDRRERHIVEHRLMADDEECQSLAELGRFLGVSRERARQIEVRAKRKLAQRCAEITRSRNRVGVGAAA